MTKSSAVGTCWSTSSSKLKEQDPRGYELVEKFFAPILTFTPELRADFSGTFSMTLDPGEAYTYKSQHLKNATLTGANDAVLIGNAYDNILTGNIGDNLIDGGDGDDTVVFSGPVSEYEIEQDGDTVKVTR